MEEVTLDVMQIDEYEGQYEEIWSVFEAQNPGIKINVFPLNEDMAPAHNAKIAGGYLPAIELGTTLQLYFDGTNYETAYDLSKLDFPWWDRWTYDVKNAWADLFDLPGPRSLEIYQGFIITWMWRTELMDRAGFNPREDVKTHEDLKTLLAEGAAWATADPDVEYFWDIAWHNWAWGPFYMDFIGLSFPDGQRDRQRDCYLGKAKFNAPDSPYRHVFEFFKEANDSGWIPERSWTRQWEPDMEGSYIGGKSVMMLHGPWPWDKMQANDPSVAQTGMPGFPPAEGQDPWIREYAALGADPAGLQLVLQPRSRPDTGPGGRALRYLQARRAARTAVAAVPGGGEGYRHSGRTVARCGVGGNTDRGCGGQSLPDRGLERRLGLGEQQQQPVLGRLLDRQDNSPGGSGSPPEQLGRELRGAAGLA
jgi:ABC-type glycerol-3-phosphate transport system substrate-binding protein